MGKNYPLSDLWAPNSYCFVDKQTSCRYDIVPLIHQNNKEILHNNSKKMSLIQKDRLNFQKIH